MYYKNYAFLAEWSKALVLRSNIVKMRGFEPHRMQLCFPMEDIYPIYCRI